MILYIKLLNKHFYFKYFSWLVGRSVGRLVGLSARFLSNRGCGRYQTWICGYVQLAIGTARVWSGVVRGPKIIYSYYTRCTLIRDWQLTAWDGFAHPAEIEVTCIWKVKPSDSSREISKMSVL